MSPTPLPETRRAGSLWERIHNRFEIADLLVLGYYSIALLLLLPTIDSVPTLTWGLAVSLIVATLATVVWIDPVWPRAGVLMRVLVVYFSAVVGYELAYHLIENYHKVNWDVHMITIDDVLFGGQPSVWAQSIHHPWLTEYLQIIYVFYYLVPMVVITWLLKDRAWDKLLILTLAGIVALHFNQAFYPIVPVRSPCVVAISPGYEHLISYDFELQGLWFTDSIREYLFNVTKMRHDCFPSGHTMLTSTICMLTWRLHRKAFWTILPMTVSIVFSTIYLRYHYLIDVVLGLAFAALWTWLIPLAFSRWRASRRVEKHAPWPRVLP